MTDYKTWENDIIDAVRKHTGACSESPSKTKVCARCVEIILNLGFVRDDDPNTTTTEISCQSCGKQWVKTEQSGEVTYNE